MRGREAAPGRQAPARGRKPLQSTLLAAALLAAGGCGGRWLPRGFEPPEGFATESFRVRPITVADAAADFEAVMASREAIHRALLSEAWPPEGFTLERNREELAQKERLFRRRRSFTYTVVDPAGERVLGSVYVNRGIGGPDAAVFFWVRSDTGPPGLEEGVERAVRGWMEREWPFGWVVFPGSGEPG